MDEKHEIKQPAMIEKAWWRCWRVLIYTVSGLLLVVCTKLRTNYVTNAVDSPVDDQKSFFQLNHIYRHGVEEQQKILEGLAVTEQFRKEAGELYREEVLTNDFEEPLWTANGKFATDNPFEFKFSMEREKIRMRRLKDRSPEFMEGYLDFALESPLQASKITLDWGDEDVYAPNVTDKDTIISLALMSSNAYVRLPHTGDWRNLSSSWNESESDGYGWDGDGLRGHVFFNKKDNIVVIAIKGTSAQGLPGSGDEDTAPSDKVNDNLLFSCCCARVSYLWTTVCDCYKKSYTCDESCLEQEYRRKDRYYAAAMQIYKSVLSDFPGSTIWLTGHSLGGALASLLARTYGWPAVVFEAPGELLAAKRLHLPFPPGLPSYQEAVWNIGHTADPIFMGTCNGASSSCSIAGYAMETACHTGRICVYDPVSDKGWRVSMLNHRIHTVIDGILSQYDQVARCKEPEPCVDCFNWKYIRGNNAPVITSKSTITSTSTSTASSCVGRNWFGKCTSYGL
ncbi:related to Putative lipase ATG15 [Zygosaccharomyces bailii]|uniref:Putative lipase ATG15 n=1 Tax=Zygosaccharomyces bailii (strain CLIB 213 / ATCC 58445 / CBS 680 / BCRC 21525 / NBRC 1098 / NCYC 1416 / NRRL Y-2227) TaxID=1333698 RepID=A0A8J2XA50_ZYGB2|nr:ZYBA0S11-00738g1_1 [Zygosaccharomyces bailii CLIB 213]SJM86950.1 related to Putative lipase ATG15 [Zygosaccharomyces bailii]